MFLARCVLLLPLFINCYGYEHYSCCYYQNEKQVLPQDVMVDVINNLAVKLLALQSEDNKNNIAISPYGAVSVLVALLEGTAGTAKQEIHRAAQIPSDRSLIRIGLRDINRLLKSYFIPEEGFLYGLSLSPDNVSFNQEYKDILKFYGFDFSWLNDRLYSNSTEVNTSNEIYNRDTNTSDRITTESFNATENYEESTLDVVTTVTKLSNTEKVVVSTYSESNVAQTEFTTFMSPLFKNDTNTEIISTGRENATSKFQSTMPADDENIGNTPESTIFEYSKPTTLRAKDDIETITLDSIAELITLSAFSNNIIKENSSETNKNNATELTDSTVNTRELIDELTTLSYEYTNNDTKRRRTRSVVDYIIGQHYDEHVVTQIPSSHNSESYMHFLINGEFTESNINFMKYIEVLPFYHISYLDASALKFPLDSANYYLLLILPENPQQIDKLICDLRHSNLKDIIDNLRYTYVKAVIPNFMLKGNTILTPTFQKMGIQRVFEPRQVDFSPMTKDQDVYVTNIEQAITINIRNYMEPSPLNINRNLHAQHWVLFKADHPFLYFVIDSALDVALMAGKVMNPLNSRIR